MQEMVKDNPVSQTRWFEGAWRLVFFALALGLLAAITGFAFAGWSQHGTDILLNYAQSGLSWCL